MFFKNIFQFFLENVFFADGIFKSCIFIWVYYNGYWGMQISLFPASLCWVHNGFIIILYGNFIII